ncbi:NAD-dependent epimerase/dehydratase family protein [Streptomyces sp. NPDC002287]
MAEPQRLVITGATGFIGSAVLAELARIRDGAPPGTPRLLLRAVGRTAPGAAGLADEWRHGDLSDPASLRGSCEGADVLLHLAGWTGSDERECVAVNVRGTGALMAEAGKAGVRRIVQLSTTAVYGRGPHRGIEVDAVVPAPESPASRTRLAGEALALAAGAVVLRPGLVIGAGDRWVVPGLEQILESTGALWDGGRPRVSVVEVRDLARLIARVAFADDLAGGTVWHASHPVPVRVAELVEVFTGRRVLPRVDGDLSEAECLERMAASGCRVRAGQFKLVAQDHWYDSAAVWDAAGCLPGPGPLEDLDEAASWYREYLGRG